MFKSWIFNNPALTSVHWGQEEYVFSFDLGNSSLVLLAVRSDGFCSFCLSFIEQFVNMRSVRPWSGVGVRIRYAKNIWVKQIELVRLPNLMETVVSCHGDHYLPIPAHTIYSWTIKWQKCAGISGLWVLKWNESKEISWKYDKIMVAVWKLPAK